MTTASPAGSAPLIDNAELIVTEHRYGPGYHLSPQDLESLRSRADAIRAGDGRRIAGYFRSCTADAFSFEPHDLDVLNGQLPECRLMLIVKPFPDGRALARVFQPVGGVWLQTSEFELIRTQPTPIDFGTTPFTSPKSRVALISSPPVTVSPPPGKLLPRLPWRRVSAFSAALLFLSVIGAAWWLRAPSAEAVGLGLTVSPAGDFLSLTWNRDAAAVKSATAGVLRIDDGSAHRDLTLDLQQLSSGSVLYRPVSRDLTFRLEIRGVRRTTGETVRVVSGTPLPPSSAAVQATLPLAPATPAPATVVPAAPQPANVRPRRKELQPEQPPSLAEDRAPESKPQPLLSAPAVEASQPVATVNPPPGEQPPTQAAAKASPTNPSPGYQTPWEPLPSVMHYLNDEAVTPPRPIVKVVPKTTQLTVLAATEIRILVAVNPKGGVAGEVVLDPAAGADTELVKLAMAAARHWKFEPALDHGRKVPATYTITFRFLPSAQ